MRILPEEAAVLKRTVQEIVPDAGVYLFGSRADDTRRGGDIDILVIASRSLDLIEKLRIKNDFYKQFGERKIDIVSYAEGEQSAFRAVAESEAIAL